MDTSPPALSTTFLVLFSVLLVFLCCWIFWPFLTPIAWALILWRLFSVPHEWLASVLKGRRAVSATMMTLGVMTLVVLPLSYTSAVAASELMHVYDVGKAWVDAGGLAELPERVAEVPADGLVVAYCHHGVRSRGAAAILAAAGRPEVVSLAGGIDAWSRLIDASVQRY